MALLAGKYEPIKNENLVPYLVSLGVPEEKAVEFDSKRTPAEVTVDGKKVTVKGAMCNTYVLDEEVDETLLLGVVLKSTAKLSGNTLTITSKAEAGQIGERIYAFTESGLTLTMKPIKSGGPTAIRSYKRV